ncbi:MAG: hypothetical protein DWB89_00780 [Candidatus Poseidoniales archaeon]|nr:MAG: hypothetical protein DWB89_00780 [Candidatus Poseidoniales archaeon]
MSIEQRRNLVVSFLKKCVKYANDSIDRKTERGVEEEEISRWSAYRDFTEHAVMEVSRGDLDSWLEEE